MSFRNSNKFQNLHSHYQKQPTKLYESLTFSKACTHLSKIQPRKRLKGYIPRRKRRLLGGFCWGWRMDRTGVVGQNDVAMNTQKRERTLAKFLSLVKDRVSERAFWLWGQSWKYEQSFGSLEEEDEEGSVGFGFVDKNFFFSWVCLVIRMKWPRTPVRLYVLCRFRISNNVN